MTISDEQAVFACYTAASHDPAVYSAPDEFRADRDWKQLGRAGG
jgi:cytochrome P450